MAAIHEFQVKLMHLDSKSNRLSDLLSRWNLDPSSRVKFFEAARDFVLSELFEYRSTGIRPDGETYS